MHYYRGEEPGRKVLISAVVRGIRLNLYSYTSLFSGSQLDTGTELLLESLVIPEKGEVLDVGCGYGAIGIFAALVNPRLRVYMIDVNPLAVKISRYNAKVNGVADRVTVLLGDRYKPVEHMKFDAIYSNPPLSAGMDMVEDIVLGSAKRLKPGGHAQFVLAKGGYALIEKARSAFSAVEARSKKGYILLYLKP